MKLSLLVLLLSACSHNPRLLSLGQVKQSHYIVQQTVIGLKCPNDHYLGIDGLCHTSARVVKAKPVKRLKKAARPVRIDCTQVYKQVNSCMAGN